MRKLIIVLMLVALLAGCAKPPEPTATNTPEPTATNTPEPTVTNTPLPTYTSIPTKTPVDYLTDDIRGLTVEMFDKTFSKGEVIVCKTNWAERLNLKLTCEYTDNAIGNAILTMISYKITEVVSTGLNTAGLVKHLPDDFIVTVIASSYSGLYQVMSKTSMETLKRMIDETITTQIEWEQEAEIIK